jgi:two-component sensor histidine kinase
MEMDMLWSSVLTAGIGFIGFVLRNYANELQRIQVLLNRTREEMAREYVTKAEVHADINRVLDRIERLDLKLDRLIESHTWDGSTERRSR